MKRFRSGTIIPLIPLIIASLPFAADASGKSNFPPGYLLTAKDDSSEAALNQAAKHENRKITVEPLPTPEHGPALNKAKITTEPAPLTIVVDEGVSGAAKTEENHASNSARTAEASSTPHHDTPPASGHGASSAVPATTSLKWLMNGNIRYLKKAFRADGRGPAERRQVYGGQHPHAIVLSCADSRVPPELIFDQGLGEIFVIRVAGQALDSSVIASVEYAVEHVGPKLLVVLGHTKCGAVDTALKVAEGSSAGSAELDKLLADIRPRLKTVLSEKRSHDLEVEGALNADGVARDLLKRSEIVRKAVEAGDLVIKTGLYRLDSGKVNFY